MTVGTCVFPIYSLMSIHTIKQPGLIPPFTTSFAHGSKHVTCIVRYPPKQISTRNRDVSLYHTEAQMRPPVGRVSIPLRSSALVYLQVRGIHLDIQTSTNSSTPCLEKYLQTGGDDCPYERGD